jgi:hypothetical protein
MCRRAGIGVLLRRNGPGIMRALLSRLFDLGTFDWMRRRSLCQLVGSQQEELARVRQLRAALPNASPQALDALVRSRAVDVLAARSGGY